MKRVLTGFLMYCLVAGLLLQCSSGDGGTNPDNGGLSGMIAVSGQIDPTTITVKVYETVEPDQAMLANLQRFPNIGIPVNQQTEFDHRKFNALATSTVDANGNWSVDNLSDGQYNVVAELPGGSWRTVTNVSAPGSNIAISIAEAQVFQGAFSGQSYTFDNDFLRFNGSTVFESDAPITFRGSNYLLFTTSNTVVFRGNITFAAGAVVYLLTTSSSVEGNILFDDVDGLSISGLRSLNDIELILDDCDNISLSQSSFFNSRSSGLRITRSTGTLTNCLFRNSQVGVKISQSNSFSLTRSLFYQNAGDVELGASDAADVNNCLFSSAGDFNLEVINANTNINHNQFEMTPVCLKIADISEVAIENNHFSDNQRNITFERISHQVPTVEVRVVQNNFLNTSVLAFDLESNTVVDSVDARNNYWGTTNTADIDNLIHDFFDVPALRRVYYQPIESSEIPGAGISQ